MGNIFNDDFRDFIRCFNECDVKYILVGGYSVILHGYSRTTGDMDIWVERTQENYKRIEKAFIRFGMPVFDMTEDAFLNSKMFDVFSFGHPPSSIDLMVAVKGLDFADCYAKAIFFEEDGLSVRTIFINDLIAAKKASGRAKDINDLENLNPKKTMMQSTVPILISLNEKETIKFYTETLGFTFYSSWEGYLIFGRDSIFIHHSPCDNPEIAKNTGCYVNVTEVDILYAEYEPHGIVHPDGGALELKPWGMKQFSILDNNGNIIHFGEDMQDE